MSIETEFQSTIQNVQNAYNGLNNLGATIPQNKNIENIKSCLDEIYDNLPKTEYGEGTSITLSNCNKGKLDFDNGVVGIGQTVQDSTQGYQLFDKDNANVINAYFDANSGKLSSLSNPYRTIYLQCNPSQTYTISKIQTSRFSVGYTTTTPSANVSVSGIITINNATSITITTGADATYLVAFIYHASYDTSITFEQILESVMIEQGSTAHSWEKYTGGQASPNPSYPQTINSVTGNQEVVVSGKNLIDKDKLEYGTISQSDGTTISPSGDVLYLDDYVAVEPSSYCILSSNKPNFLVRIFYYGQSKNYISTETHSGAFTTISTAYYIRVQCSETVNDDLMLVKGTTSGDYEPYITPTSYQLSLGDKELYEDSFIDRDSNGDWYFNDYFGKYSGKLTYNSFNTTYNRILGRFNIESGQEGKTGGGKAYCNIAKNVTGSVNTTQPNASFTVRPKDSVQNNVNLWYDDITTDQQAQTFLSNTDFIIVYEYQTPIRTKITDETLISQLNAWYNAHSLNGTTIITSNGDLPLIIKCRGLKGE